MKDCRVNKEREQRSKQWMISAAAVLSAVMFTLLFSSLLFTSVLAVAEGEIQLNYTVAGAEQYITNVSGGVEIRQMVTTGTIPEVLEEGELRLDLMLQLPPNISDTQNIFDYKNFSGEIVWKALTVVMNNSYGKVQYRSLIDLMNFQGVFNVSEAVQIRPNEVFLNASYSELNATADIFLYGLALSSVRVTKDGTDCLDCVIYNYSGSTLSFRTPGFGLYKGENGTAQITLRLSRNVTVQNSTLDIRGEYYNNSYPANVTVDIGNDGITEFNLTGELNSTARTVTNLTTSLNALVTSCTCSGCSIENSVSCLVPVTVQSLSQGTVIVENLNLTQHIVNFTTAQYVNQTTMDLDDYFFDENNDSLNYTLVYRPLMDSSTLLLCSLDSGVICESGDTGEGSQLVFISAVFDNGSRFNATSNLTFAAIDTISRTSGTFDAWIIPLWNGTDSGRAVIMEMNASSNGAIILYKNESGYLVGEVFSDGSASSKVAANISSWFSGQKHHVAFVWSANNLKLYTDGVLRSSSASATMPSALSSYLFIGTDSRSLNSVNATLDMVRITNSTTALFYNSSSMVNHSIDPTTRILTLAPGRLFTGDQEAQAVASDGRATVHSNSFTLHVLTDTVPPVVSLITPIQSNITYGTSVTFTYNATDNIGLNNCSLYHNISGTFSRDSTTSLSGEEYYAGNFVVNSVPDLTYFIWTIDCSDVMNVSALSSENRSVTVIYPVNAPRIMNATFNVSSGLMLDWEDVQYATSYQIYASSDMKNFTLYDTVTVSNYTDMNASRVFARYYRLRSVKTGYTNDSIIYLGKLNYTLREKAGGTTINWVGNIFNRTNITYARDLLYSIPNATAVLMWNSTLQTTVSCNKVSCPASCSESITTCNFSLDPGLMVEVLLDNNVGTVTFIGSGVLYNNISLKLNKNATSYGKNWVSMYSNTSLARASNLMSSVNTEAGASIVSVVSRWEPSTQKSQGWLSLFGGLGTNFNINTTEGYEIHVTSSGNWTQK